MVVVFCSPLELCSSNTWLKITEMSIVYSDSDGDATVMYRCMAGLVVCITKAVMVL